MNIVDSSGWLEYFSNTPNAEIFAKPIENIHDLLVPSITIAEVFKKVLKHRTEQDALQAVAHMNQGQVISLDSSLAIHAAKLGHDLNLPLADSMILASARLYNAVLWTQDSDFSGIDHVRYIPKSRSS